MNISFRATGIREILVCTIDHQWILWKYDHWAGWAHPSKLWKQQYCPKQPRNWPLAAGNGPDDEKGLRP